MHFLNIKREEKFKLGLLIILLIFSSIIISIHRCDAESFAKNCAKAIDPFFIKDIANCYSTPNKNQFLIICDIIKIVNRNNFFTNSNHSAFVVRLDKCLLWPDHSSIFIINRYWVNLFIDNFNYSKTLYYFSRGMSDIMKFITDINFMSYAKIDKTLIALAPQM